MQPAQEAHPLKVPKKRLKSATRFPKKLPTYIVAFALKETYDDLVTAQQMICSKRSPQESTNSITPTNSLKMFESEQVEKLDQILDAPENNDKNENNKYNGSDDSELCEVKIEKTDENNESNILSLGQVKTKSTLEENFETVEQEFIDHNVLEEILDTPTVKIEHNEELNLDKQPQIIFNAKNYGRRSKENKCMIKKSKNHKNVKTKCNKFKCKAPKKYISNGLERYYEKAKRNSVNTGQIQRNFNFNISTVLSRTSVLKKVSAKENLLEEIELISISNNTNLNENDDGSQHSSSITNNGSFISNLSGNTLTHKSSTTSSKIDVYSIGTVKSVIRILSSDNVMPYKTDVINVAVAVAYKKSKGNNLKDDIIIPNKEKFTHLGSLTSTETLTVDLTNLTSETPLNFENDKTMESIEISDATLINIKSSLESSDDETFDMARTSLEFNESSIDSTYTLKNNLETVIDLENPNFEDNSANTIHEHSLLQTVINLGYYPEVTPSTSSARTFGIGRNDIIVTEHLNQSYPLNAKYNGDNRAQQNIAKNVLIKQFNQEDDSALNRNVNLPNQAQIKAMLQENDMSQRKCADEFRNYPSGIPEMWDKLVLHIDLAFKKLEETVTENIIRELKKTLCSIEHRVQSIPKLDAEIEMGEKGDQESKEITISTKMIPKETDQSLQCNLVQSHVIDQIVLKLSAQDLKIIEPIRSLKTAQKLKKTKIFKDYLEVLKPPAVVSPQAIVHPANTVTMSTITEEFDKFRRLKMLFVGPYNFMRENVFVITSVPAFFVILLFVYGLLLLIMKPW